MKKKSGLATLFLALAAYCNPVSVVLPEKSGYYEKYAADELVRHIRKMTGKNPS